MMFTWEWNPSFGGEKKPQEFEFEGQQWTYARGGRHTYFWVPLVVGVWCLAQILAHAPVGDRVIAGLTFLGVSAGWLLSRRYSEKGWRLSSDNHLWVVTQSGKAHDVGQITEKRYIAKEDFECFKSKSFNSLRFPMLRFNSPTKIASVIGTLPKLFTHGFQIPFTAGFFYTSITWGSFELQSGLERSAWVETDAGNSYIIVTYTPEALAQGLSLNPTPSSAA